MPAQPTHIFSVATGSAEPIYRQLMDQVRRMAASGQLAPGDLLPSVREVAQALALNPMTVSKAYSMLEAEGVLARSRGTGMLVADSHVSEQSAAERGALLRPALERAAREAKQLGLSQDAVVSLFKKILKEQA